MQGLNARLQVGLYRPLENDLLIFQDLRCNSLITEENGKQCPALTVFSMSIRYMKSQLMNDICLHGKDVDADEIRWVITVPAIWGDLAKQFTRRAAERVGHLFNRLPRNPWFLRVCSTSFLKTLQEKEKLLVTSNFSFSHSVSYPFGKISAIFMKIKIVVCKLFQFGQV